MYNMQQVMQEPALDSAEKKPYFKVSPQMRGIKGLNGIILWVEADNKSLAAYQGDRLLWKTNVVEPCARLAGFEGTPEIQTVVSQSTVHVIFVQVGKNAFAEVDRKTGLISSTDIQQGVV